MTSIKGNIYKLGRSGRLAIMLPKEAVFELGEYNIEILEKTPVIEPQRPTEPPSNVSIDQTETTTGDIRGDVYTETTDSI